MPTINLPLEGGRTEPFRTGAPREFPRAAPPFPRVALAAAHVVADPLAAHDPVDWRPASTGTGRSRSANTCGRSASASRRRWTRRSAAWASTGTAAQALIRRSLDAMRDVPGAAMASGAGTDHLEPGPDVTVDDVIRAYEEQCEAVERDGRAHHPDGLARPGQGGARPGRLRARLRPHPRRRARAGHHPLAGRDVRPGARRLLGQRRPHARHGDGAGGDRRPRGQGGRREDLAPRQGEGDRHAAPPAGGRPHVHRRRLRLRGADRGRRAGPFRRAARHLRPDRAGGGRGAGLPLAQRPARLPRDPGADRAALAPHLPQRRRASTRRAWCSWPG